MNNKGSAYEKLASRYLQKQGLKILQENYHSRYGEIDLIMQQRDTIVFVEVRHRANNRHGGALESVDRRKQRKIVKTAMMYVHEKQLWDYNLRFDVIAVYKQTGGLFSKPAFDWISSAFEVTENIS